MPGTKRPEGKTGGRWKNHIDGICEQHFPNRTQ